MLPHEERFFDLFGQHADAIVVGAEELRAMLEGGEAVVRHYPRVLDAEDRADAITREVVQAVRRTFVTPFDRGDIQDLIGSMDDTLDQMKKTAKAISLFGMTEFSPDMRRMGDAILRCARLLREAVPQLSDINRNVGSINALCESIRQTEGEADDIHDAGVTTLFRETPDGQAMRFIAVREVFDLLERVVDRFDDAANQVEGIVIEHV
ncbi:DUF47 domain-containing protein [Roseomonas elaeocarpi]|uniref:DUF47 domain-containing protein n=1 Tax=Roseomonas elaeocarpi TaxID=907779 RepID=A0ABV6JQ06_9PROT